MNGWMHGFLVLWQAQFRHETKQKNKKQMKLNEESHHLMRELR